jgi:hypothetical protein
MAFPPLLFTRLDQSNSIAKTRGVGKQPVTLHNGLRPVGQRYPDGTLLPRPKSMEQSSGARAPLDPRVSIVIVMALRLLKSWS